MKILVTGSRHWTDDAAIRAAFSDYPGRAHVLIHGMATGADALAAKIADERGWMVIGVPADWQAHGKAAGPLRNRAMLDMNPDVVLAFPLPDSRGTIDCITEAQRRGIAVHIRPSAADPTASASSAADDGRLGVSGPEGAAGQGGGE